MTFSLILIEITHLLIIFGVPFFALVYPRKPAWPRNLLVRLIITTLTIWILLIAFRSLTLPYLIKQAEAAGNPTYDGVGGNVATLVLGWVFGIIGCLPALIIRESWDFISQRRNRNLQKRPDTNSEQANDSEIDD